MDCPPGRGRDEDEGVVVSTKILVFAVFSVYACTNYFP
jgi:hypothetical protein